MAVRIQLRRDLRANWQATNPTLAQGELGYETDFLMIKLGDGTTLWNDLPYYSTNNHPIHTLLHNVAETCYMENSRTGGLLSSVIYWTTSGKTQKVREYLYTRTNNLISQVIIKQYNDSGILIETLTIAVSRTNGLISNQTFTLS